MHEIDIQNIDFIQCNQEANIGIIIKRKSGILGLDQLDSACNFLQKKSELQIWNNYVSTLDSYFALLCENIRTVDSQRQDCGQDCEHQNIQLWK